MPWNFLGLWQRLGLLRLIIIVIRFIETEDEPHCVVVIQDFEVFVQDDDAFLEVIDHLLPACDFIEFLRDPIDILLANLTVLLRQEDENESYHCHISRINDVRRPTF